MIGDNMKNKTVDILLEMDEGEFGNPDILFLKDDGFWREYKYTKKRDKKISNLLDGKVFCHRPESKAWRVYKLNLLPKGE
jgi:hypothetical protein